MTSKLNICIIAHNAYGNISGKTGGFIGGVEWQTTILAKWLSGQGHKVTMVTWDEGGEKEESYFGVRVLKICKANDGLKGLRFFHPKWTSLTRALRIADSDLYYHNCGECVTGQVALWCKKNNKKLIFSAASNADCDKNLPELNTKLEKWLYRYGLRNAELRIVQTFKQKEMLSKNFNLDSTVIPMPCQSASNKSETIRNGFSKKHVLWVGRISPVKRPALFLEVARMCPDFQFDMVGPFYSDNFSDIIAKKASNIPNLKIYGGMDRESLEEMYKKADCLCCTSEYEGFPNTFLEAWSHGLPIVSTFDPDKIVERNGLGCIAITGEDIALAIKTVFFNLNKYSNYSKRAYDYVNKFHRAEKVMPIFESIFLELALSDRNNYYILNARF